MDLQLVLSDAWRSTGEFLLPFLLVLTTVVLLLWYSSNKQTYWKKLGVPYVKPLPLVGSIWDNTFKNRHKIELSHYRKLGKIYGHYEANRPVLCVGDPDLLRKIMVKDFHSFSQRRSMATGDEIADGMVHVLNGEDWKRVRSIISPSFSTGKIRRMLGIFKECSETLMNNFRNAAEKGEPIEIKSYFNAAMMDIIASSAFSTKVDSFNDPNNIFVETAKGILFKKFNWRVALLGLAPGLMKALRIPVLDRKFDFFAKATLQIIEERKRTGKTRNDFLQLLMDTAKESKDESKADDVEEDNITENYGKEEINDQIFKMVTKKTLSTNEMIGNCVIFFLAGYENAAIVLANACYQLALNPEVQEKAIQELDEELRKNNGDLTYEVVQNLKYLDNVISEALRMYPPAIKTERVADEDYELGDTGIVIPKGMLITIPIYALHWNPEHFPEPEKFDPDRFSPEERSKRHQFAYLPFGHGPRNCIAMRFALMEGKVCLAYVLNNFRLRRCAQTKVPLEFFPGQGMLLAKEIVLKLEIRQDSVKIK